MSYVTEELTFDCHDAFMELGDQDDPLVQRIVLKTDTLESGQVTLTPKKEVTKEMKIDGVPGKQQTRKLIPASELDENLKKLVKLCNEEGARITANVTEWDQSDEEETDGDETYYFIRRNQFDTIQAKQLPDDQAERSAPESEQDESDDEEVIFDGEE